MFKSPRCLGSEVSSVGLQPRTGESRGRAKSIHSTVDETFSSFASLNISHSSPSPRQTASNRPVRRGAISRSGQRPLNSRVSRLPKAQQQQSFRILILPFLVLPGVC